MPRGRKSRINPTTLGAELFVAWMKRHGHTQREVAQYLDWPDAKVHRILHGLAQPSAADVFSLEDLCDREAPARAWTHALKKSHAKQNL